MGIHGAMPTLRTPAGREECKERAMYHWLDIRGVAYFGATPQEAIAKAMAANRSY